MKSSKKSQWVIVLKYNGKEYTVTKPGGLHEAEAVRNASLEVNKYAHVVRVYKEET